MPTIIPAGLSQHRRGVYTHNATGFVVHEAWNIADLVDANGVFAYSVTTGAWRWLAGTDLKAWLKSFGINSMPGLAASMMSRLVMNHQGLGASGVRTVGGSRTSCIIPALHTWNGFTETVTHGDVRIFALVNNFQAGHGCSRHLCRQSQQGRFFHDITDVLVTKDPSEAGYMAGYASMQDLAAQRGNAFEFVDGGIELLDADLMLGRAVIAIPMKSWETYKLSLKASTSHNDKSEVASRITAALGVLDTVLQTGALGPIPTFRIPVVIGAGGKIYFEPNYAPHVSRGELTATAARFIEYSPYTVPAVNYLNTGFWFTNPLALTPGSTKEWPSYVPSAIQDPATAALTPARGPGAPVPARDEILTIDGVHISKIAGGLTGVYVSTTGIPLVATSLVSMAMNYLAISKPSPVQLGNETSAQYEARMGAMYASTVVVGENYFPHTWTFLGQPALIASLIYNESLQDGGKVMPFSLALMCSGYFSLIMRIASSSPSAVTSTKIRGSTLPPLPGSIVAMIPGPTYN